MQCPACGATNPESAAWCGQCYRRFDEDVAVEEPPAAAAAPAADGPSHPASRTSGDADGFRRVGTELEWECPECATFNGIELTSCAVCGTSFLQRFRAEEPEPQRNWSAALLLSAFAPGAGHLSVGRYGTGWARLLLFVVWVAGALLLASSGGAGAVIAAAPLLLGALILWAVTLFDVYRLQQGESEILVGRAFLWLVVGVLVLMAVALFGSTATATPRG